MSVRFIKICGVKDTAEAEMVQRYADAMGVVVGCRSRHEISPDTAKEIIDSSKIPVYLVSTLKDPRSWKALIDETGASHVQVHSDEADSMALEQMKEDTGVYIMKAFKVPISSTDPHADAESLMHRIGEYEADKVLLDTGAGTGIVHDLGISERIAKKMDIILAGGLDPHNISRVVSKVRPYGVDVSSGVEIHGNKSEERICQFCKALRTTDRGDG